jgi:hypothetical protein
MEQPEVNTNGIKLYAEPGDSAAIPSLQLPTASELPPWCPCRDCPLSPHRHCGSETEPIAAATASIIQYP